jgi:hypothetical protein
VTFSRNITYFDSITQLFVHISTVEKFKFASDASLQLSAIDAIEKFKFASDALESQMNILDRYPHPPSYSWILFHTINSEWPGHIRM